MKISVVNAIAGVLSGIKINKITDKAVKTALVNDYLHLRKFAKEASNDAEELRKKFREDWADELDAIVELRQSGKPVVGHKEYLDAERDANQAIQALYDNDVEVSLKPVKMDAFLTACGGEELTFEQLAVLQENGLIE